MMRPLLAAVAAAGPAGPCTARPTEPTHDRAWMVDSFIEDADLAGRFLFQLEFEDDGSVWLAAASGLYRFDGYDWTRFTVSDGLPSNFVRCVRRLRDGGLLVGTDQGVVRFDGRRFEPFPIGDRVEAATVRRIVEEPDGTLWFCCDRWLFPDRAGGLYRLRGDEWTRYGAEDGLDRDYVTDLFVDSHGRHFVGTRRGLFVKDGERWMRPPGQADLAPPFAPVWSMVETPAAGVIVAVSGGIYTLRHGEWTYEPNEVQVHLQPKILATRDGEVLTVTNASRKSFDRWNGEGFDPVTGPLEMPGYVEYLAEAPDGAVWCIGLDVLMRWPRQSAEWSVYDDLPPPRLVDDEGAVWFAGPSGGFRLSDRGWTELPGLPEHLFADGEGAVWGWSDAGIARCAGGGETVELLPSAETGIARPGYGCADGQGGVWFNEGRPGNRVVAHFDGAWWTWFSPPAIHDGRMMNMVADTKGGVWILIRDQETKRHRLVHIDDDGNVGEVAAPADVRISMTLGIDPGGLWLLGLDGARRRVGGEWVRVDELPANNVFRMGHLGDATWFAYSGISGGRSGISRLRGEVWEHFNVRAQESHAAGSAHGLAIVGRSRVYRLRTDTVETLHALTLPMPDPSGAAFEGADQSLWTMTEETVVRYRPDGVPPRTVIRMPQRQVAHGSPLRVTFEGIERFRPRGTGTLAYSWRIDDGPWSAFGPGPDAGLPIDLAAGSHVLAVRARDEGLDVDPVGTSTTFEVRPVPLQARTWFWPAVATIAALLGGLGVASLALWSRSRKHAANLETVVEDRTTELRESEGRFRRLVEHATDAFFLHELHGRIVDVNAQACGSLGYSRSEILEMSMPEIEPGWQETLNPRGDPPETRQAFHRRRDGATFPVEAHYRQIEVGGRALVLSLIRDTSERRQSEVRQRLMMNELDHRVKNNLAVVMALADRTLATTRSPEEFADRFSGRLLAMARTHESLARHHWEGVDLGETIHGTLEPFMRDDPARVTIDGDEQLLPARIASAIGLVLHELTTNAAKYGALSVPEGRLQITWTADDGHVELSWIERGGPPASPPERGGLGLTLIEGLVGREIGGSVSMQFEEQGLRTHISFPVDDPPEGADQPRTAIVPGASS